MAKFFLIGCQVNEIEIKELLLKRYGRYLFPEMSFDEFIDFLVLAMAEEKKDKIRGTYYAMLPFLLLRDRYMTFEEFYDKFTGADIDWRPADEILKEAEEIQEKFANGS